MKQIIFIHGGETFDTEDQFYAFLEKWQYDPFEKRQGWRESVVVALADEYQAIEPSMPNKLDAHYHAWKIWFEKLFPYLSAEATVLVGHSLGGLFLAKYLSEQTFPKRIAQLHLVAPVLDNDGLETGETVGDFTLDIGRLPEVATQCDAVHIYCSEDDPVCPPDHSVRYAAHIPGAQLHRFTDRGHFLAPTFPELLEEITRS